MPCPNIWADRNCTVHRMSAPSISSQTTARRFAFGYQAQQHANPSEVEGNQPARVQANPRARDLHQRADQMFALGYTASGWKLREQAWKAEGTA